MKGRIQEIEHSKQAMVKENDTLKNETKNIKEQLHNSSTLNNTKNKLDIKPIKEEINKLIVLYHEHHKRALHLIIVGIEEQNNEDMLELDKEELKTKSQIQTTYLTEAIRVGKILEHKHRLICVKVSCNGHKLDILRKSPSLKGTRIFINEDLIPKDQVELRK